MLSCYAESHLCCVSNHVFYAEYHNAECCYDECLYVECRGAQPTYPLDPIKDLEEANKGTEGKTDSQIRGKSIGRLINIEKHRQIDRNKIEEKSDSQTFTKQDIKKENISKQTEEW
jgi:hypothetical protein